MKKPALLFIATLLFITCKLPTTNDSENSNKESWTSIFNGKDLQGWTVKISGYPSGENYGNTFRVEDGIFKVSYDEYDQFGTRYGHIFYEKELSRYKLKLEYRFVGDQAPGGENWAFKNSGIMFHSHSASSMLLDQGFPVSLEAQLLGGNGKDERPTGNLCTPGMHVYIGDEFVTQHCITSTSRTIHDESWVPFELVVMGGDEIHHIVHGDTVMSYHSPEIGGDFLPVNFNLEPGTKVDRGFISLQSESHPIEFRNIQVLILD